MPERGRETNIWHQRQETYLGAGTEATEKVGFGYCRRQGPHPVPIMDLNFTPPFQSIGTCHPQKVCGTPLCLMLPLSDKTGLNAAFRQVPCSADGPDFRKTHNEIGG